MKVLTEIEELEFVSHEVRRLMFKTVLEAGSGHLGGSSSSVELMVALYFGGILRYDPSNPRHPARDRVLVRGHLGPLRYSLFALLGWIDKSELSTYRSFGSRLHGHESMEAVPGVDITPSGMLGMGLSFGVGSAIAIRAQHMTSTVYAFLGDGEEQEGNVSEAARHAGNLKLTNLVCIIDCNGKQLSQPTMDVDGGSDLVTLWRGYGWSVKVIGNGHSLEEVLSVLREPRADDKPTLIIAHTIKGNGLCGAVDHPSGYHTISSCPKEYVRAAMLCEEESLRNVTNDDLGNILKNRTLQISRPIEVCSHAPNPRIEFPAGDSDDLEEELASYFARVTAFVKVNRTVRFYPMTADVTVKKIAHQCGFDQDHVHYIDVGIREQHLLGMAHGLSVTDPNSLVLITEGEPFLFRAIDQLHAIAQAGSRMIIIGADSGICEARNGPTHQTTGQPGALLSMPGLTLLEPADVVDLNNCLNWAFTEYPGPVYIRLHSGMVARLPVEDANRNLQSYIAYQSKHIPRVVIATSGLPMEGAMRLARRWDGAGVGIKVINVINMKSLSHSFVDLLEPNIPLLVCYNGNPFVLQSAIATAILEHQSIRPSVVYGHGFTIGTTGLLEDLLKHFQFDETGVEAVVRRHFPSVFP